ncbi:hypothetical protein HNY73_007000 [Argiope bruennichi]|uniref:Uncharacterized protein n=1 Tax=Argiope bruennichi TaxID=94029 RepID=A0A8T0FFM3_ARGBR|nr:hypothetical protein HNY73_007000 [Argiope bruennichi]
MLESSLRNFDTLGDPESCQQFCKSNPRAGEGPLASIKTPAVFSSPTFFLFSQRARSTPAGAENQLDTDTVRIRFHKAILFSSKRNLQLQWISGYNGAQAGSVSKESSFGQASGFTDQLGEQVGFLVEYSGKRHPSLSTSSQRTMPFRRVNNESCSQKSALFNAGVLNDSNFDHFGSRSGAFGKGVARAGEGLGINVDTSSVENDISSSTLASSSTLRSKTSLLSESSFYYNQRAETIYTKHIPDHLTKAILFRSNGIFRAPGISHRATHEHSQDPFHQGNLLRGGGQASG